MRIGLVELLLILLIAALTIGPSTALWVDRWMRRAQRSTAAAARRRAAQEAQRAAERRREAEAHEKNVRTGKKRPAKKAEHRLCILRRRCPRLGLGAAAH